MRVILGPGERDNVQIVRDVKLGPASMIDALSGNTMTAVALGITHLPFDAPEGQEAADRPTTSDTFLLSEDDAFELMCGLVAMFGADHE